jgi:hypothetical protein
MSAIDVILLWPGQFAEKAGWTLARMTLQSSIARRTAGGKRQNGIIARVSSAGRPWQNMRMSQHPTATDGSDPETEFGMTAQMLAKS